MTMLWLEVGVDDVRFVEHLNGLEDTCGVQHGKGLWEWPSCFSKGVDHIQKRASGHKLLKDEALGSVNSGREGATKRRLMDGSYPLLNFHRDKVLPMTVILVQ